ncbi:MAG: hypothetical protein M3P30_12635 [Chloroflexota bacterium]|nr:hypothetical protein [Chloroflexota bacterium]
MAVATVVRFAINPGKNQEFMALAAEAKKIHERLGGKVRIWNATLAGPDSGNVSYVIEHANIAAYASFSDKMGADAEWLKFVPKAFSANPAGRALSSVLITEATM